MADEQVLGDEAVRGDLDELSELDGLGGLHERMCAANVGQEVGDVIEVTSDAVGLATARFRVTSVRLRYTRGGPRPAYEMTLGLGDV